MKRNPVQTVVGPDGILVKIYEYYGPRKSERSWKPFEKYSISNVGYQGMKTGRRGINSNIS